VKVFAICTGILEGRTVKRNTCRVLAAIQVDLFRVRYFHPIYDVFKSTVNRTAYRLLRMLLPRLNHKNYIRFMNM